MWEFIVLGLIPGTSIQVSFNTLVIVLVSGLILGSLLWQSHRHELVQKISLYLSIYRAKRHAHRAAA